MPIKSSPKNERNYEGSLAGRKLDPRDLPLNQPDQYERLFPKKQAVLREWLRKNIVTTSQPGTRNSYSLKHHFERSAHSFYVTNGMFKGAMLAAGHDPVYERELNWVFCAKLVQDRGRR